jgi:hypothetical protein
VELCLEQTFSSAHGPCVGFDTFAGGTVNVAVLIALAALLALVVRVLYALRGEAPTSEDEVKRIVLRGPNPWLFVGGYFLLLGASFLARFIE